MKFHAILRRDGWRSAAELERAAARSSHVVRRRATGPGAGRAAARPDGR
jgi:hypothetical protein